MDTNKPHRGTITNWFWLPISTEAFARAGMAWKGLGFKVGGIIDGGDNILTSIVMAAVTSPDEKSMEIETMNSRYTVVFDLESRVPATLVADTRPIHVNKLGQVVVHAKG